MFILSWDSDTSNREFAPSTVIFDPSAELMEFLSSYFPETSLEYFE